MYVLIDQAPPFREVCYEIEIAMNYGTTRRKDVIGRLRKENRKKSGDWLGCLVYSVDES